MIIWPRTFNLIHGIIKSAVDMCHLHLSLLGSKLKFPTMEQPHCTCLNCQLKQITNSHHLTCWGRTHSLIVWHSPCQNIWFLNEGQAKLGKVPSVGQDCLLDQVKCRPGLGWKNNLKGTQSHQTKINNQFLDVHPFSNEPFKKAFQALWDADSKTLGSIIGSWKMPWNCGLKPSAQKAC